MSSNIVVEQLNSQSPAILYRLTFFRDENVGGKKTKARFTRYFDDAVIAKSEWDQAAASGGYSLNLSAFAKLNSQPVAWKEIRGEG